MRASTAVANSVDAVGVAEDDVPRLGFRPEHDAGSHARIPSARLLEAGQIIHQRRRRGKHQAPALPAVQRQRVLSTKQSKPPGAQLLKIVAGQRQWEFRHERQGAADAVSAESVGVHAGAGGQADGKIVFQLRQCVGDERPSPEQVRMVPQLAIAVEPVRLGVGAELAVVPRG